MGERIRALSRYAFLAVAEYMRTSRSLTHWKDYGGTGDLIVLVHGLGGSLENWDAIGPRLAEIGHTVAMDLPGPLPAGLRLGAHTQPPSRRSSLSSDRARR